MKVEDPTREALGRAAGIMIDIEWSGEFEQMQAANKRLMWIVPVSIGLIMILLYTAFNSAKDALLVMANVVAATMGGVWALKLTGTHFSISAAVGFISIFGVAVQDGVLLISYFNQMRQEGISVREAVMRGAELRVRPVVMTSLTAALGLFPAAIATSIGSQAQRPLAIVVVGGMLVTLLLTRYLMPVLYSFFPAPEGHGSRHEELIEGSHFTDEIIREKAARRAARSGQYPSATSLMEPSARARDAAEDHLATSRRRTTMKFFQLNTTTINVDLITAIQDDQSSTDADERRPLRVLFGGGRSI